MQKNVLDAQLSTWYIPKIHEDWSQYLWADFSARQKRNFERAPPGHPDYDPELSENWIGEIDFAITPEKIEHTYKVETVVDIFSKVSGLFYAVSQVQLFFLSSFLTYYATK